MGPREARRRKRLRHATFGHGGPPDEAVRATLTARTDAAHRVDAGRGRRTVVEPMVSKAGRDDDAGLAELREKTADAIRGPTADEPPGGPAAGRDIGAGDRPTGGRRGKPALLDEAITHVP